MFEMVQPIGARGCAVAQRYRLDARAIEKTLTMPRRECRGRCVRYRRAGRSPKLSRHSGRSSRRFASNRRSAPSVTVIANIQPMQCAWRAAGYRLPLDFSPRLGIGFDIESRRDQVDTFEPAPTPDVRRTASLRARSTPASAAWPRQPLRFRRQRSACWLPLRSGRQLPGS